MILKTADEIIGGLERGQLAIDLAQSVQDVLTALYELGEGKGHVTLKLGFSAKDELVQVQTVLTSSIPKKPRRTSNFFLTKDGQLSQQHSNQIELFRGGDRRRESEDQ